MKITNIISFLLETEKFMEQASASDEPMLVYRPDGKSVVVMSLDQYNALKEKEYKATNAQTPKKGE